LWMWVPPALLIGALLMRKARAEADMQRGSAAARREVAFGFSPSVDGERWTAQLGRRRGGTSARVRATGSVCESALPTFPGAARLQSGHRATSQCRGRTDAKCP